MRRAVPMGVVVAAVLLLLGSPFRDVRWGFADDRMLPTWLPPTGRRPAARQLSGYTTADVSVVVPMRPEWAAELDTCADRLSRVPDM